MAFSQSVRKSQVPLKCNLCENDTIEWKCEDCGLLLCTNCSDTKHSKIKNAQNHKVIDIKQVGVYSEAVDFTNIKCKDHPGQLCCLFCTNCDSLVCPICIVKIHKKHDLIEISEGFYTNAERLKKGQNKIQTNRTTLATKKELLEQCKCRTNEKCTKVLQNIQNHGIALKKAVDKYIEELKNEVRENKKLITHQIDTDIDVILRSMKETDDKNNETEELIKASDIAKFFREVRRIEKSIEILVPKTQSSYNCISKFVPGEINQSNVGVLQRDDNPVKLSVALNIISEYQTEFTGVSDIIPCPDKSIWINCNKDEKLIKVKLEGNILNTLSSFKIDAYGIAVLPSNDILLSTAETSRLQQLSVTTGKLTDTVYDVAPLVPTVIHITSDNKIIVGGNNEELGRKAVFVMNKKGDHETVYEHDEYNQLIFKYPWSITCTSNCNIHVVDCHPDSDSGRVVVLGQGGDIINTYTGHTDVNKNIPFQPVRIVTTPRDKVVVVDFKTNVFHILNNAGEPLTQFNTKDNSINNPFSLAFTSTGQFYIGCTNPDSSTTKKAEIYHVTLSGC
ncbi:tripartite motif-containing protein 2/3 [Mytilus galloprovincialis]|uniref:Tripartite motif-containing protein 2/3 n=1 Tax=Mytilus galloprovincialis TaxID=29158 RepID=A0A8B6CL74_MYTGA|nr:tripartite motif-containing protein 2/3 [Mytilus galloprovincialis]